MLMGVVVAFTLVLIAFAYNRYVSKNHVPVGDEQTLSPVQRILSNKYYVDELYDFLIVKPLYWISATFDAIIERLGIDKLVNTLGNSVVPISKAARLLQSGGIGYYIFVMVIGIVVILALAVIR